MNKNQSIGMYVILGIMVLAFISMLFSGPTSSTEELSYTTFIQKVENKENKKIQPIFLADSKVSVNGKLKSVTELTEEEIEAKIKAKWGHI